MSRKLKQQENSCIDKDPGIYLTGLLVLVFFSLQYINVPLTSYEASVIGHSAYVDLYSKVRSIVFPIATLFLSAYLLYTKSYKTRLNVPRLPFKAFICLSITVAAMSYLLSPYKELALSGSFDSYQGVLVYCSYFALMYLAYCLASDCTLSKLVRTLAFLTIIAAAISLLQRIGSSPFDTPWFSWFFTLGGLAGNFKPSPFIRDSCESVFGNPNYVGTYCAMVLPMLYLNLSSLQIASPSGRLFRTAFYSGAILLGLSLSDAGLLGTCISLSICRIVQKNNVLPGRPDYPFYLFSVLLILASLTLDGQYALTAAILCGIMILAGHIPVKNPQMLITKILGLAVLIAVAAPITLGLFSRQISQYALSINYPDRPYIYRISQDTPARLEVLLQDSLLGIEATAHETRVYVDNHSIGDIRIGEKLRPLETTMPELSLESIDIPNQPYKLLRINPFGANFFITENSIQWIGPGGKAAYFISQPVIGPNGLEHLGSGRYYIWNLSLQELQHHLLIGDGPDTFIMSFPNDNLLGRLNLSEPDKVFSKPHNTILQLCFSFGVAYAVVSTILLIQLIRTMQLKSFAGSNSAQVLLCALIGFIVSSVFNDLVIVNGVIASTLIGFSAYFSQHAPK